MMTLYRIPDYVFFAEKNGESVLLDIENGVYYGLNETGTSIWNLIKKGSILSEIITTLKEEYDTADQQVVQDVQTVIAELESLGLIKGEGT